MPQLIHKIICNILKMLCLLNDLYGWVELIKKKREIYMDGKIKQNNKVISSKL